VLDRTEINPARPTANTTAMAKTAKESGAPPKPVWLKVEAANAQMAGEVAGDESGGDWVALADAASVTSAVGSVMTAAGAVLGATDPGALTGAMLAGTCVGEAVEIASVATVGGGEGASVFANSC
jgi:hypothetical protein